MSPKSQPTVGPAGPDDVRGCSVEAALSAFGDKWSLLAVREIARGTTRFDAMLRETGASRDMLTNRLRRLEDVGVVHRVAYQDRPPRHDYLLTASGADLLPVLVALRAWGDKHVPGVAPDLLVHDCGATVDPVTACRACGEELTPQAVTFVERS
ncbi:hypothetical protein ASD11_01875 [Aeromicrobium sp. Root495]|uniref:winged helix-turn-helix transcriptional regulator n=1 Tax=Aeromicrobium sp. Root495 TaxID=1736550 RepID=UPI000701BB65|nr:helix-turn-helix domain-containing protein [Aeromicrobium sp. Root495]KQY58438.1 hypothetical protein ASD11_01875 [Aeromicrobium sp. Root495]